MTYVAALLDKAKNRVSPANYATLAARMDVSRQLVSLWKQGQAPLPDERIAQLARIAGEDASRWLVAIHSERAHGEAAKGWAEALRRLGAAAAVVTAVALILGDHTTASALAGFSGLPLM